VTDARGNTLTHEYDAMDRLSRRIDPLGQAETFSYDGNGNLVRTTDRKSQTSTFTYDALDRRTTAEYADGAVASFTYDTAGRLTQADDVNGRLWRATQGHPIVSQRGPWPGPLRLGCPDLYSACASCFEAGFPRRCAARCCLVCSAR